MSRCPHRAARLLLRFPRVSGDEPRTAKLNVMDAAFSPRERG